MLTPEQAEQIAEQRKRVRRSLGQGRRWFLRAVLMAVIAFWALYRGGQMNTAIGVVMLVLAALSVSMGRSVRRQARQALERIDLLEKT